MRSELRLWRAGRAPVHSAEGKSRDVMPLLGIQRVNREAAELRLWVAAPHILDDRGDQRLVAEVVVAHVTEDADLHGTFRASATRVYPNPAHSLSRSSRRGEITQPSALLTL